MKILKIDHLGIAAHFRALNKTVPGMTANTNTRSAFI